MGREARIALVIGLFVMGALAGVFVGLSEDPSSNEAAAAAKAAPVPAEQEQTQDSTPTVPPKQQEQAQHEKNPPHVRLSNVKLLHPPEKKDFSKVAAPEKDKPDDEEESD